MTTYLNHFSGSEIKPLEREAVKDKYQPNKEERHSEIKPQNANNNETKIPPPQTKGPNSPIELLSRDDLEKQGINLDDFTDEQIMVLRKFNSGMEISDRELPALFAVSINMGFLQNGEKSSKGLLRNTVDDNWIAGNAYNQSIEHWENIAGEGDVIAGATLGLFYETSNRSELAVDYYKKVIVNIEDKEVLIDRIISITTENSPRTSAILAYYFESEYGDLDIKKELLENAKKNFDKSELEEEILNLKTEFEYYEINHKNNKEITLMDYMR